MFATGDLIRSMKSLVVKSTAPEGGAPITRIFGVNIQDLDELGEGQEYQEFLTNSSGLGGAIQSADVELVVGLDQSANDSFVMPVKEQLQVFEDPTLHRQQRVGYYGFAEFGFGVLDNRRILLGCSNFKKRSIKATFIDFGVAFLCIYR